MTGGGGEHVIFTCPDGVEINSSSAGATRCSVAGIDIRARGGYIVAPPTRHMSGRAYAWSVDHHPADIPIAEAPAWLVERLAAPASAAGRQRQGAYRARNVGTPNLRACPRVSRRRGRPAVRQAAFPRP